MDDDIIIGIAPPTQVWVLLHEYKAPMVSLYPPNNSEVLE